MGVEPRPYRLVVASKGASRRAARRERGATTRVAAWHVHTDQEFRPTSCRGGRVARRARGAVARSGPQARVRNLPWPPGRSATSASGAGAIGRGATPHPDNGAPTGSRVARLVVRPLLHDAELLTHLRER